MQYWHPLLKYQVPVALFPIQLPATASERITEDGPSMHVPATHIGDSDGAPGSRLQPAPALVIAAI